MIPPQTLGSLANIHELITQLVENLSPRDVNRRFHPLIPSMGWLLGKAVYRETYLLREEMQHDDRMTARVSHLFGEKAKPSEEVEEQLPPQDHLLNWAREIFEDNLMQFANPAMLPDHPWLENGWLPSQLAQLHAQTYEQMLACLTAKAIHQNRDDYSVEIPLTESMPQADAVRIDQGHYRIGAREGVVSDRELPMQMVELHSYRINKKPVSNAEYLAFINAGGYHHQDYWDDDGWNWLGSQGHQAPWHWRQDTQQNWYGIGIQGGMDIPATEPVGGLSAHEARAFAAWASAHGKGLSGAVPQHEYQWETAARMGKLEMIGRTWEWCSNELHSYPSYETPKQVELSSPELDSKHISLRGACLHSQPSIRRASYRRGALPGNNTLFAGTRLVMPPGKAAWD